MFNQSIFKSSLFAFLLCSLFIVSCSKDSNETTEEFVDATLEVINRTTKAGAGGCFEFVFPISITFEDGSVAEVESYEALKAAVKEWKENNPDAKERPQLNFPLEVINSDGELISISAKEDLRALVKECKTEYVGQNKRCFKLVYPLSILFPDGSSLEVADRKAMKMALREWKENNPDSTERPTLAFPIEVELEDGTIKELANKDELLELKKACKG